MSEFCGGKQPSEAFQRVIDLAMDEDSKTDQKYDVMLTDEELHSKLEPAQFCIARECGTELPNSGKHLHSKGKGHFECIVCDTNLFSTGTKFNSGTGWPSFTQPNGALRFFKDYAIEGRPRIEVVCGTCGAHLGHVFDDGPKPGQLRYCINSLSLNFKEEKDEPTKDCSSA